MLSETSWNRPIRHRHHERSGLSPARLRLSVRPDVPLRATPGPGLWVLSAEGRFVVRETTREFFGSTGHAKVPGGGPGIDLISSEFDPSFDGLEHLDLEGGEQH